MKQLEDKIARVNILVSCVVSSSKAPIPSVSMTMMLTFCPSDEVPLIGLFQHHNPLVQGLMVGPTPNPLLLQSKTLFSRYDLPVLYNPATLTTARGPYIDLKKSIA